MTPRADEAGFTLVELLITIVILGVGVVAVLGALQLGVVSAYLQGNVATASNTMISFSEHVRSEDYVTCADGGTYGSDFEPVHEDDFPPSVESVEYWDGGSPPFDFDAACGVDHGVQRLTLVVGTPPDGGPELTMTVIKRSD